MLLSKAYLFCRNCRGRHGNGWADKKDVARAIVSKFPELKVYLTQDRAWKERFHQNMFDAVALGIMAAKYKCG